MESSVKRICPADSAVLADILAKAYPNPEGDSEERRTNFSRQLEQELNDESALPFYGLYRKGRLLGAMRLLEFKMKLLSAKVAVGGIGGVCVDSLHKKEKVSFDLLVYALHHFHAKGINLVSLYPFNTEFYKKMGFGYGTMAHQFKFQPKAFPNQLGKHHLVYLEAADKEAILDCYHRYAQSHTGMFDKSDQDVRGYFGLGHSIVGVRKGDRVTGYLVFRFDRKDDVNNYDLLVTEWVYTDRESLHELCAFLHSQSDQVQRIIVNTQDQHLYYLMSDPTSGRFNNFMTGRLEAYSTGIGSMYRVLDVKRLFLELSGHDFGSRSCRLKLTVTDPLLEAGNGSCVLQVVEGRAELADDGEFDTALTMDIANFSSMMVGAIGLKTLYDYGLAELSDERQLDTVHRLFAADSAPRCHTNF